MKEILCYECGLCTDDNELIDNCLKDENDSCICPKCGALAYIKEIEEYKEWNVSAHVRALQNWNYF